MIKGSYILLVEDNLDTLDVMKKTLTFYGANVLTATNGLEAIAILGRLVPDLIVTDLQMPLFDGGSLLEYLSRQYKEYDVPVVISTAFPPLEAKKYLEQTCAKALFEKPFAMKNFISKVEELLAEKSASDKALH